MTPEQFQKKVSQLRHNLNPEYDFLGLVNDYVVALEHFDEIYQKNHGSMRNVFLFFNSDEKRRPLFAKKVQCYAECFEVPSLKFHMNIPFDTKIFSDLEKGIIDVGEARGIRFRAGFCNHPWHDLLDRFLRTAKLKVVENN